MELITVAVDAPFGTGRIELSNARFEELRIDSPAQLNEMKFGACDEHNIRFDGGRHMLFNAKVKPTAGAWSVRLYGNPGACYMWFEYKGTIYERHYPDGTVSKYDFQVRPVDAEVHAGAK